MHTYMHTSIHEGRQTDRLYIYIYTHTLARSIPMGGSVGGCSWMRQRSRPARALWYLGSVSGWVWPAAGTLKTGWRWRFCTHSVFSLVWLRNTGWSENPFLILKINDRSLRSAGLHPPSPDRAEDHVVALICHPHKNRCPPVCHGLWPPWTKREYHYQYHNATP